MKRFVLASIFTSYHFILAYLLMPFFLTQCGEDAPFIKIQAPDETLTAAECKRQRNLTAQCAEILTEEQAQVEAQRAKEEEERKQQEEGATEGEEVAEDEEEDSDIPEESGESDASEESDESDTSDTSDTSDGQAPPSSTGRISAPGNSNPATSADRFQVDRDRVQMRVRLQDLVLEDEDLSERQ